jgi:hypothetical protein
LPERVTTEAHLNLESTAAVSVTAEPDLDGGSTASISVMPAEIEDGEQVQDARIEGVPATAAASGVPGRVVGLQGLSARGVGNVVQPSAPAAATVIGDITEPGWWAALPPGVPRIVRTAAIRAKAVEELRRIEDVLREALPQMSPTEEARVRLVVGGPISEAIDLLNLCDNAGRWAADETSVSRFNRIVALLTAATTIAATVVIWKDAADLMCKALAVLGVDCGMD